ncbi:hypothetical protein KPH14_002733 [Odynerus spinipes]|uniref:Uncharacterized protein n=1 Tax=Odynerus spinipes TaxID=1348599 RepID=A0AAD9RLR2_9HYME|nr:hypothetical protein KPH14_002733 [Odynerus spinipes]
MNRKFLTLMLLVALFVLILPSSESKKVVIHVPYKIHVPEIIKHHIHTKTIFIHKAIPHKKHVPKRKEIPKKKMPLHSEEDHKEGHHEWKYWTSYFHQGDHGQEHRDASHDTKQEGPGKGYKDYKDPHKSVHSNDHDHPDSYFPQRESYGGNLSPILTEDYANGAIGYSYPPQYSAHPEHHEVSDNHLESPTHSYEEGYRKGLRSESGAVYTKELNKFNYDTHREEEEEEEGEMDHEQNDKENEEVVTTHAGRYFVSEDDVDDDNRSDEGSEIIKEGVSRKILRR